MLLSNLNLLATAPGGVARLRELILTLAVQGKLVPQDPNDEPASDLLKKIRVEKNKLIAEGMIKRDKPLAAITDEEKPFGLPVGWEWVRFGVLPFSAHTGLDRGRDRQSETGAFPYFKMNNISNSGGTNCANMTRVYANAEELAKFKLKVGDFLFNTRNSRELVGKTCVIDELLEENTIFNNNILVSRFHGLVDAKFIDTWFRSPIGQLGLDQIKSATTNVCAIYQGNLFEFLCALPPRSEQSRIVTRVEELMRLCDALEAKGQREATQHAQLLSTLLATLTASETPAQLADNWRRIATHFDLLLDRPQAVDALEQTILQLAVRGLLVPQDPLDEPASVLLKKIRAEKDKLIAQGKIKRDKPLPPIAEDEQPFVLPLGWEWVRLDEIADNRLGKMLDKAKNTGKRYPYLRNTNVQWRHIDLDDIKEISLEASELEEFRLLPGDLLICEGGYPGRCAIWSEPDREMYFQKALHRVRPRGGIAAELISISLESDSKSGNLDQHFTGATIKHFVGQALGRYLTPLPPLAEQSRIVTRVAQLRRLCADLRQRLTAGQSTQAHLVEALVQEVA